MTRETVLSDARLMLPEEILRGSVLVRDGRIADVAAGGTAVPGAESLAGDYLLPGLVELHTDHIETQAFPRPGVAWPMVPAMLAHDAAVACAGITTVFDALPLGHDAGRAYRRGLAPRVLEALDAAEAGGVLRAEHRVHLRCELPTPELASEFAEVRGDPRVALVSVMDHTPGQRQFVDLDKYREYYGGRYGLGRAELEAHIASARAHHERHATANRREVTAWCRQRGIPVASHDDATAAHIAEAGAEGVSIAEFPTTREAAESARQHGLATVMGAPNVVRGGSHSGNVAAGELAAAGCLDALSSDYVPASLLPAAWRLAAAGMGLARAVATVTHRPAGMAGLDDRGRLAAGCRADLLRVRELAHGPTVLRVWRAGRIVA